MEAVCILDLLLSWPGENTKSIGMNKQWILRLCLPGSEDDGLLRMKIKNFMIVFVSVLGVLYGLNIH